MFRQRPLITDHNQLQCPTHNQTIDHVSCHLDNIDRELRLTCSDCTLKQNEKHREATLHVDYQHQICIVSLLDLSAPLFPKIQQDNDNNLMDFRHMEIEHITIDEKSQGYSPRNLVYLPDKGFLVACSSNGHVTLWSVGEQLNWRSEFNVEKPINFAKYINRGEHGNNYLILGIENYLNIYDFKEESPVLVATVDCEMEIYDIEWISKEDKLISAGYGNVVRVWNLKTFSLERVINIEDLKIRDPIQRVIYLSHKNSLALGYSGGLCIVNLEEQEGSKDKKVPRYRRTNMKAQGFAYLAQSRSFVIRCARYGVQIVAEETMELLINYPSMGMTESSIDSRILVNENGSQFMMNSPASRLTVYTNNRYYSILRLHAMVKENGVLEVIKDQHRVVVGDKDSGVIYILRTNADPNSGYKLSGFEKDTVNEAIKREVLARGSDRTVKGRGEISKDQIKERATRIEKENRKIARGRKGNNDDVSMEIEEPIEKLVRKTRSRSKKVEDKTDKKEAKRVRGKSKEEKQEEKAKERSKSRRGKKK